MYIKPTDFGIRNAIEDGWDRKAAERGYDIFDYNGTGLLAIERIDSAYVDSKIEVTDIDCAIEAHRSGFCKIIPLNELPKNFEYQWLMWVDTPENREKIVENC